MEIKGGNIFGGEMSSNDDHRIAMMAAILASVSDQPISIQKPMAVNKSYPSFYDDLEQIAP
jgi:3-phosphoshikimate 1-carboxyvinyltransferase